MRRQEQALWQHRYWEHMLRDERDFERHVEYIHYNPVKHDYVASPLEWPHSSFRRYVEAGLYDAGWGQGQMDFEDAGHERKGCRVTALKTRLTRPTGLEKVAYCTRISVQ